jgi:hypothetical protein
MNIFINGVHKGTNFAKTGVITNDTGVKLGLDGQELYGLDGKLADFRIYNKGYDQTDGQAEALRLYQTSASLDVNGNLHTRVLVEGGQEDKTLCDYTEWTVGTGSLGSWSQYGSTAENSRVEDLDPWGRSTILWNCIPAGTSPNNSDGGFYSPEEAIDKTKLYRLSVWANRKTLGTDGNMYLGIYPSSAVNFLYADTAATNPYFWTYGPDATRTPDDWFLIVGHVFPYTTAIGSSVHPESGQYYPATGVFNESPETSSRTDYRWKSTSTVARIRCILYGDEAGTTRLSYIYPRIDLVDGTEPTIADLLSGNYYDSTYANDITNIGKNGTTVSTNFSEVGVTDGLLGYWPLNGNMKDYSGNERHGETGTSTVVEDRTIASVVNGFAPRDKACYSFEDGEAAIDFIGIGTANDNPIILGSTDTWSVSCWGYHTTAQAWGNDGLFGHYLTYTAAASDTGRFSFNTSTTFAIWTTVSSTSGTLSFINSPEAAMPVDKWFNFVVTHNASSEFSFYLDGYDISPVSTYTRTGDIYVNRIGMNPETSGWTSFDGNLMDFRIYDHVLTSPEINILSKTFDTDSVPRTEMKAGGSGWYTFGEFQEDL